MKIRSALAATALTTAALVAGATSADAATTTDRHIDTHAAYYQTQSPTTIVNSWHGHPVVYIANQGSYGYVTCSGGIASPIYVEDVALRDGIALNVVKHEFTHVLECWNAGTATTTPEAGTPVTPSKRSPRQGRCSKAAPTNAPKPPTPGPTPATS